MLIEALVGVGGALIGINVLGFAGEKFFIDHQTADRLAPAGSVEVVVPALNEEQYIADTLESLLEQNAMAHPYVSLTVMDNQSEDATRDIAREYADQVKVCPRGLLRARHTAIVESDADIVAFADCGDTYPDHWLTHLLSPFSDEGVVAAHGPKFSKDPLYKGILPWLNLARPFTHMSGSNFAVRREAYLESEQLDLSIDEMDRYAVVLEGEVRLLRKLKDVGTVKFVPEAAMLTSQRHRNITFEDNGQYMRQRAHGIRF